MIGRALMRQRRLTIPCYLISYILSIPPRERGRRGGSVTPEEYGAEEEEHVAGGAAELDREDAADDAEHDVGRVRVLVLRDGSIRDTPRLAALLSSIGAFWSTRQPSKACVYLGANRMQRCRTAAVMTARARCDCWLSMRARVYVRMCTGRLRVPRRSAVCDAFASEHSLCPD